ncbi:hypothetical protein BGZ60DRAFT_410908 [Tricladium varicosporioides]|nr:hypothetical protein BGZ60DRAFT_410908 [Hymenoscyphus varicosporioides]
MTTVVFFCTSKDVTVELIKEFVVESQRPEGTTNIWTLVRDPSQTEFEECVGPLDPIESGFLNSSIDDLRAFTENVPEEEANLLNDSFVVLDERSTRDKTCALHHSVYEMPADVPDGEWIDEKAIKSWKEWRVPFSSSAYVALYLERHPWGFVEKWGFTAKKDNVIDGEGVLQLPSLPMKEFEMLDDDGWPA